MRSARALLVLPVVLLSGCGVAGTQFHPGVAAEVEGETITSRHLDQVTDDYCKAIERVNKDQPDSGGIPRTPLRYLSHDFATALVIQAAAEQLADEYDVEPSDAYRQQTASLEPQIESLPEAEKDAVREVVHASDYVDDVLTQIGEQVLSDDGTTDATADDQLAAGHDRLDEWVKDHDVVVNPRYSVEFGTAEQVDTDLSYAADDTAKAGLLAEADAEYAAALPDSQVCLD